MISAFFTKILVALAAILGIVWLCAWLHEKGIRPLASLKKMSFVGLCAFMLWAAPFIQYGSTKGGGGTNNVPQLVIQPGTWLVPMASTNAQHQTATGEIQPMNQGVLAGMSVSESEQPALPITSTNTDRTIIAADFERGFIQTRIGTDEAFNFSPPQDATIVSDWWAFGAATDWIYVAFTNWAFQVGTNDVNRMRVYSFGKVEPLIREKNNAIATNYWFALGPSGYPLADARPSLRSADTFMASLGIVPQANWDWLAETDRPSQVWYVITPEGSLLITWQNALLDRDTDKPISFQIEFKTDGQFIYRYDLSRLDVDSVTNILAGASYAGNEWTTNSLPTNITSMAFYPLSEEDIFNQDRDGDGLNLIDELFVYGTDPVLPDSDFDGIPDNIEVASGTNPAVRDSDNDGLVDGSDPDPAVQTSLTDLDGDGIPDAYENHWFGGTNIVDSLEGYSVNGFNLGFELASGINPANNAAVFMPTNRIAAWKITDGFATGETQFIVSNVYERTFHIARNGSWEQYFLSSKPDRAGGWQLEGLTLDWEDSEGESGTATASPAGDSLYLPVSTNSPANLTLRLRSTANTMACRSPLYLLAYSPSVELADALQITTSNATWLVSEIKEETPVAVSISRTERPCKAALYPGEADAEFALENNKIVFEGGGTLLVNAPGVYRLPNIDLAEYSQPVLRAKRLMSARPPSGDTNECYLAFLNPSVSYGGGHHADASGMGYDSYSGTYYETYEYPFDSGCLWRSYHSDSSGGYVCTCQPELSAGFDIEDYPDISTNLTVSGETATGSISIGGTQVWSDTAMHNTSTGGGFTETELLSDDGCDDCSGCEDGNCDKLEGDEIGSLKFRIPLGIPRRGQVSGFAWFRTDTPLAVGVGTLQVTARGDANVSDSTSGGTRTIVCSDNQGRTLAVQSIENGIEITITETASGSLEHTWRIVNVGGSTSNIRLTKNSRLNNTMSDRTYTLVNGNWSRFDHISQTSEELIKIEDLNGDGIKREEHIVRDADDKILSHTVTVSRRFGFFANAVLRQTYYAEKSWGAHTNNTFASYYTDNDNPKRNGNVQLEWGNARAWRFNAYDTTGRTILTLEQFNGSECPISTLANLNANAFDNGNVIQWLSAQQFIATATVYDYTPLAGDDANSADADKVRIESRFLLENGSVTLIGRTWTRYTHGETNGYATVTVETITAGAQEAGIEDICNQRTIETCYDSDASGIPLTLRGRVLTSTDADGITTENTYSISGNVLSQTSRMSYMSQPFPVSTHTERCATYGNVLREWNTHAASGLAFDEKRHLYDDKNRLVSTIYSDGSFTTNAYSCCRLLWNQDRTGRKVLRSAATGQDHLYYAMEEVSLAQLPHDNRYIPYGTLRSVDNHYRVTQHFMDALGHETNTTVRVAQVQGCATNQCYVFNKGWRTSETTTYPDGVSDYEIATDARGNETTTKRYAYSDREVVETIETNKTTIATTYRNGRNLIREEWSDGKWKETETVIAYYENGCRTDTTTVMASDHEPIVTQTIYRDFLGRTIREVRPTSDVTYAYDGTSSRVLTTVDSISGETATRLYDECGKAVGQLKNGITSRNDTAYEVESNILWRITSQSNVGSVTNICAITQERLTELSDELRSETLVYQNGALAVHSHTWFDPTNFVLTEVSESATAGTVTTKSKFGIIFETTTQAGTTSNFFDPYGRVFYTEKDGRSIDWIGRNDYGDVEEYDTFFTSGDNVYAEFYGYDNFGNRTSATNALGAVTVSTYDLAQRLAETAGAVYPVRYSYDTENRRTALSTTRDGINWDTTSWTFNPATGFRTVKTYADGTTVVYSYTPDGKPLRTTYASGRWHENAYNAKRELVSTTYSDGETCAFAYDEFSNEVTSSNDVSAIVSTRNNYGQATNETIAVGSETYSLDRSFDAYGRMIRNDSSDYTLAPDGQLAAISNALASVEYLYTADLLDAGYMIALPNGVSFTRSLTRDAYRRSLVTGIESSVGGNVIESFAYSYDALNRPTTRNADIFGYNDRSEVTSANISGFSNAYDYDEIGNLLLSAASVVTNLYTANNLNQYTSILRASVSPWEPSYDPDGNLLSDGGHTFTYDAASRLKTVSTNGVLTLTNFYDAKSRRVRKVTPEAITTFFYDDWNLIEERIAYTNGTTSTIHYYWGKDLSGTLQGAGGVGGLLYITVDGTIFIPCYDNNGNITRYLDSSGATVAQYTYDAFGNTISQSGPLADLFRHRFSTKYFDAETGLYYYGYRFYHPLLMRWLNRDPLEEEGGLNLYTICKNAPLFTLDLLGKARMITGALMARKNTNRIIFSGYDKARDIIRLVDELNQMRLDGHHLFDAKICDFVTIPISEVKRNIAENGDNVYIIAHGGLTVNGRQYSSRSYTWNEHDTVIEKLFPNGQRGTGVDVKSLGPKLNMQNVFGCYLSSHVRKIRHGRFFPTYTSSIDDYANMYRALYTRLLRYKSMRPNCLIEIRIYEGENANEADKKYAETDYVQRRWPIKAEEFYK